MVKVWRALMQETLLPTILVAVALLFAPLANAMSMPCHDQADQAHSAVAESPQHVAASDHDDHPGHSDAVDHGSCCSFACSACVVAINKASDGSLVLVSVSQHYGRDNQVGHGLAIPPIIGPPRFQV